MLNLGGTYRAYDPKETLAKIEPMLWDVFGITRVANITGLDNIDIPTYVAIRPWSKFFSTAQGKGITHDLAKISAIMESIEGWHAESIKKPDLFGSAKQLQKKYKLMSLENHSNFFYQMHLEHMMSTEIPWARGIELNTGESIYFPMDFINLDYIKCNNIDNKNANLPSSTNGLASGNTFEEALCHALYEVIERHCWYKADLVPWRYINSTTIQSPHLQSLIKHLEEKFISFEFMDMTDNINLPTFLARLHDVSGVHALGSYTGAGTHLSSEVALSRAITEAIQSRLTFISGSREDAYPLVYRDIRKSAMNLKMTKRSEAGLTFQETSMPVDFHSCINLILSNLKQANHNQVIVYDHTKKGIDVPVVHALIPSLQFNIFHHSHHAYSADELIGLAQQPQTNSNIDEGTYV